MLWYESDYSEFSKWDPSCKSKSAWSRPRGTSRSRGTSKLLDKPEKSTPLLNPSLIDQFNLEQGTIQLSPPSWSPGACLYPQNLFVLGWGQIPLLYPTNFFQTRVWQNKHWASLRLFTLD